MTSNRERVTQYLAEHKGVSVRAAARDLGVSYSTVSRVRATPATPKTATPATPAADLAPDGWAVCGIDLDALHELRERASGPGLADGWYQIDQGQPYRVNGQAVTDLSALTFDNEDEARVTVGSEVYTITRRKARPRRTVQQRG